MYRLEGGTYVCQSGSGITRCVDPTILFPGTADLHDALTSHFHKLMGTGIYTDAEQRQLNFRFYENKYEDHLRTEQTYNNKPNVEKGLPMSPAISPEAESSIFKRFAMKFNPVFHFLGEWYGYAIGILCCTAILAAFCGCSRRMCWEIKYVGCTPMILMTAFQGLWTVARMPYHMWRGAATAPATVAQKGTPFDFEDVELTGHGLTEKLTRSPPPPYTSNLKQRLTNRWRRWRRIPTEDYKPQPARNMDAPPASAPEDAPVERTIHSPKTVHLSTERELQSAAPSSTATDIIEVHPSGFQRFIKGGSHVHQHMDDRCPYPDVDRATSSRATDSTDGRPFTLPRKEWGPYYQQRYGLDQQPITPQQLDNLVKDSNDSLERSLNSLGAQSALRRPHWH